MVCEADTRSLYSQSEEQLSAAEPRCSVSLIDADSFLEIRLAAVQSRGGAVTEAYPVKGVLQMNENFLVNLKYSPQKVSLQGLSKTGKLDPDAPVKEPIYALVFCRHLLPRKIMPHEIGVWTPSGGGLW